MSSALGTLPASSPDAAAERPARRRPAAVVTMVARLLLPVLPGLVVVLALFRPLLDPRSYAWLLSPNPLTFDAATSELGWLYFANSPWHWPLGSNPDYGGSIADSLLFSDSVPAWSVPMKLVLDLLQVDGPTQVIGLGVLACLLLQSALSFAIVRRLGGSRPLALCGAGFVCLMPAVLLRWNVVSLFWQWLLLAGVLLVLLEVGPVRRVLTWAGLVLVSTGITPYATVMLLVLCVVDVLVRGAVARSWRLPAVALPAVGLATLTGLYLWGTFSIQAGAAFTGQLGEYAAAGLALVDSSGLSWFLQDLPGGTGEGYAYVGLGVLLLLALGLGGVLRSSSGPGELVQRCRRWGEARPAEAALLVGVLLLAVASVLPRLQLGSWSVPLPLPGPLVTLLSAFRANGRFLWPLMYVLVLTAVLLGARLLRTGGTVLVAAALVLQVADLSPLLRVVHEQTTTSVRQSPRYQAELAAAFTAPGVEGVEVVPAYPYPPTVPWREVGLAAFLAGHPLDTLGYFNRYDSAAVGRAVDQGLQEVRTRRLRPERVYVVSRQLYDERLAGWPGVRELLRIDDWVVLRPVPGAAAVPEVAGPVVPTAVPSPTGVR